MNFPDFSLLVLPALLCILQGAAVQGIQCYQCNNCPQPFNPKSEYVSVATCQGSCYTDTVTKHSSPQAVATRRCGPGSTQNGCGSSTIHGQFNSSWCYCSYSLCNGDPNNPTGSAAALKISLATLLSFLLAQII